MPAAVWGHVLLGDKDDARDRDGLLARRVSHVLNCTPTRTTDPRAGVANFFERDAELGKHLVYRRVPVLDNSAANLLPYLDAACEFIDSARHGGGTVLVHCVQGVSRSVSVVVAYLVAKPDDPMTLQEALDTVRRTRPEAAPNAGFMRQLRQFEAAQRRKRRAGVGASGGPAGAHAASASASASGAGAGAGAGGGRARRAVVGPARGPLRASDVAVAGPQQLVPTGHAATSGGASRPSSPAADVRSSGAAAPPAASEAPVRPDLGTCDECDKPGDVRCLECDVVYCAACCAEAHADPDIGRHDAQLRWRQGASPAPIPVRPVDRPTALLGSALPSAPADSTIEADADTAHGSGAASSATHTDATAPPQSRVPVKRRRAESPEPDIGHRAPSGTAAAPPDAKRTAAADA